MLLWDLRRQSPQTKCVVFSSWRTTLNVIQASLDHESIPCLRFDGTVTQKERHSVIERFRNDPQIRAYIDGSFPSLFNGAKLESYAGRSGAGKNSPDWTNPRSDYIEDRIIEAQASKRDLARILLNPANGDENETESGLNRLEFLRRLV
ncbi:global transactivator [Fusarium fujikuroi]|nr:global transactivator [Fusarium fujikuroi]